MMQSSIMQKQTLLCPNNHAISKIYFCKNCAIAKKAVELIFFCVECNKASLQAHTHMGDRYLVTCDTFMNTYKEFKSHFQTINKMRLIDTIHKAFPQKNMTVNESLELCFQLMKNKEPVYYNALFNNPPSLAQFQSYTYRKWLIQNAFWSKPYSGNFNTHVNHYIAELKVGQTEQKSQWDNFKLDFDPSKIKSSIDLEEQVKLAKQRIINYKKQKNLADLFLNISTCISQEQIQSCIKECDKINIQYNSTLFLIKLGKLKLFQLHPNSAEELAAILAEIKVQTLTPREKELYYYFMAVKEWVVVYNPEAQSKNTLLFLESRNKQFYKLKSSTNYISNLTNAIKLSAKEVYLASRAIGYMVEKKYKEAQSDFFQAQALNFNNDAFKNNHNLNKLMLKVKLEMFQLFQNLHERTTEYIMNLAKHLRQTKQFQELRICYEELLIREPRNIDFKVAKLDTLIKLKNSVGAREEISEIKGMKKLSEDKIIALERKIELLKAREQEEFDNYSDAEQKYENVARIGKSSATHWYNYANFLFKNRENHQNSEKALKAINEALEIKQKQAYYQLKYLVLFLMGNFQDAKKIQQNIKDAKFNDMKEHVNENT